MHLSEQALITEAEIQRRVRELAEEISMGVVDETLLLLVVLKGSLFFAADLARAMKGPVEIDYIRARSYAGAESTGAVHLLHLPEMDLKDRHVLVVEDILDTGQTASAVLDYVQAQAPSSLRLCTLLDKPSRRQVQIEAQYVGFTIQNQFVVGYGLDYDEQWRHLSAIFCVQS